MKPSLVISNIYELLCLHAEDIVYIEADRNYSDIYLTCDEKKKGWCLQIGVLAKMIEEQLGEEAKSFIRIGRNLIINQNYIRSINLKKHSMELIDPYGNKYETTEGSVASLKKLKELIEEQCAIKDITVYGTL